MEIKNKVLSVLPDNLSVYFKIVIFSVFFLNLTLREIILSNMGINITYNVLYGVIIFMVVLKFYNRVNKKYLLVLAAFLILNIVNNLYYGFTLGFYINYFFVITLPLLMLTIKLTKEEGREILLFLLKVVNYMIYFITIYGFIDMYTHFGLNNILRQFIPHQELNELMTGIASTYNFRLFTMFGHPLVMMEYYFAYFIINLIAERYFNIKINRILVCVILFFAPMLSGSKLGFMISIVLLGFYVIQNKTILYKLLNLCILAAAYFGIMQMDIYKRNLGRRFKKALDSGDISNGRLGSLNSLKDSDIESKSNIVNNNAPAASDTAGKAASNAANVPAANGTTGKTASDVISNAADKASKVTYPEFFFGKGVGYSRTVSSMLGFTNFELPILMFAYDYGILQTIMLYSFLYIIPAWIMFKNKNMYALFLFSIYFAFCNSFNGMLDADMISRIVLIIVLILSLGKNEDSRYSILGIKN